MTITISLQKILNNLRIVKKRLNPCVKICAVVKDNAYGLGAEEISRELSPHVDFFAVSSLSEAARLRFSGISNRILVLLPLSGGELSYFKDYNISAAVTDIKQLRFIPKNSKIHLKVNTGMNRLGIDTQKDFLSALSVIEKKGIVLEGVFSHFADCTDRDFCGRQAEIFQGFCQAAKKRFKNIICHIAASGSLSHKKYQFDMVRSGILLYGYKPYQNMSIAVKPCVKITAKALCTRDLDQNAHLLYGDYRLDGQKRVTIYNLGYGSGLRRQSKNFLNNLCMDLSAAQGSKKVLTLDIDSLAREYQTIPYEILTSLSKKADFVYEQS